MGGNNRDEPYVASALDTRIEVVLIMYDVRRV
jgi:hypothetical protein